MGEAFFESEGDERWPESRLRMPAVAANVVLEVRNTAVAVDAARPKAVEVARSSKRLVLLIGGV